MQYLGTTIRDLAKKDAGTVLSALVVKNQEEKWHKSTRTLKFQKVLSDSCKEVQDLEVSQTRAR